MVKSLLTVSLAAVLLFPGCKKKDESGGESANSEETVPGGEGGAETETQDPAQPTGSAFDAESFCSTTFAAADVNGVLGVAGLVPRTHEGRIPKGIGECKLEKVNEHGIPELQSGLMADCRGLSMDLAKHEEVAKGIGDGGKFRKVDIGKGGFYTQLTAGSIVVRQITYVDDTLPCSVTVNTTQIDDGDVEALAKHVKSKLTDAIRPGRL